MVFQVLTSYAAQRSEKVRTVVCGRPSIIIKNGKIVESELREMHLNINDLIEQLRLCGYHNIADVEFAIFETNGDLSIIPSRSAGRCSRVICRSRPDTRACLIP